MRVPFYFFLISIFFSSLLFYGCSGIGEDLSPIRLNPETASGSLVLPGPLTTGEPTSRIPIATETTLLETSGGILIVTWIDIGQGNSILIQFPTGENLLYDVGNNKKGTEVVAPYLKQIGKTNLDLVILSHNDADHVGGLDEILQGGINIKEVWVNGLPPKTATSLSNEKEISLRNIPKRTPAQNETRLFGPVQMVVLNSGAVDDPHGEENEDCVVIRLDFGSVSFLITGDAGVEEGEDLLSDYGSSLKSTIFNAPHHGSRFFSRNFVNAVAADVTVFQTGSGNTFGHPTSEAIQFAESVGSQIYRTDTQGQITVQSDGLSYQVVTER